MPQGPDSIEKNPAKNPAGNPAGNPAENPAENPADSTKKEGPFQYCLSHPDSIDQKGLWQLERTLFLSTVQQVFRQDFQQDFR